jgi:cystathionine beta-lyase/cystathionine gamma-synthase
MKSNKTIHGGQHHDPSTGAVMPPVFQTSTFAQTSPGKPIEIMDTVDRLILHAQH